ncbi:PREDICTED: PMS1 protein homolog 1-like [Branchiostoma belcheri]|uniref:PMS1 protein homolog 1-like n=1 Tax=Branchiostoma belcheri TaxID=7741 RepID=A0A6P4Z946_BRABE|nr:PREDICTED: PMS1 protein homolog 1-like [Branchiostoma belcheri]
MAAVTDGARSLQPLPAATARLLSSTQVITSVFSVVKELVENSLDAQATSVDVKLESFGFEKIVVSDNGSGISRADAEYMAQRHYTSKLSHQTDLDSLETYGFRGEALGSLCAVADVTVTTKTAADDFSMTYTLDRQGKVTNSKPAHLGQGTTITVTNLFKNVPVRRQYYSAPKRRKEELKRVDDILMAFGIIKPDVRFSLIHNKSTVWQKNKSADHRSALLKVLGTGTMALLQGVEHRSLEPQVDVHGFLPKPGADPQAVTRAATDRSFVFFNERPVQMKGVEKLVRQYYHGSTSEGGSSRHPIIFLSIRVPPAEIDPNVEPNKTKVLLHHNDSILSVIEEMLQTVYSSSDDSSHDNTTGTCDETRKISHNSTSALDTNKLQNTLEDEQLSCAYSSTKSTNEEDLTEGAKTASIDCDIQESEKERRVENGHGSHAAVTVHVDDEIMDVEHLGTEENTTLDTRTTSDISSCDSDVTMGDSILAEIKTPDTSSTRPHRPGEESELSFFSIPDSLLAGVESQESLQPADKLREDSQISFSISSSFLGDLPTPSPAKTVRKDEDGVSFNLLTQASLSLVLSDEEKEENDKEGREESEGLATNTSNSANQTLKKGGIPPLPSLDGDSPTSTNQKEDGISTANEVSAKTWSEGRGLVNSVGEPIEPVRLLVPGAANQGPEKSPHTGIDRGSPGRKNTILEKEGHTTMYDLVGNKPVKKPQSAYSFFIKDVRPNVCQENPEADFAEIARLIGQCWNELANQERQRYEAMATRDQQRYQAHLQTLQERESNASADSPVPRKNRLTTKKRRLDPVSHQNLIDKMFQSQKLRKEKEGNKEPVLKVVDVSFRMTWLKERVGKEEISNRSDGGDGSLRLIGRLAPHGVWVGVQGSEVVAVHQYRIQEALLYNRLMETHVLPRQPLRVPVVLNESTIGGSLAWQTLQNMSSESAHPGPARRISDPRLVSNGFDVQLTSDEDGNQRAEIVAMATCMPFYGVEDLKETLSLISTTNSTTVSSSRPFKVKHYLQGEAVRMSRSLSSTMSRDEVCEILRRKDRELPRCRTCLHSRPFIQGIYTLEELYSQGSQSHSQEQ